MELSGSVWDVYLQELFGPSNQGVQYARSDVRRNATSAVKSGLNGCVVFRNVRGLSSDQGDFLFTGNINLLE